MSAPEHSAGPSLLPEAVDQAAVPSRSPAATRLDARQLGLAVAVLAGALWLAIRLTRPAAPPPDPPGGQIVYVDVEGWYRRTPDEVAAWTPFDLTLAGLPEGLPLHFGAWQGQDRPPDPAVDLWLRRPEVALQRTYRRNDGQLVWLSLFGSRGNRSYHLFEHTPQTCYPLGGWQVVQSRQIGLPLGPRPLPANYGLMEGPSGQMVFLYFYLWDSPARDPERGVLSLRLVAPVRASPEATLAMLAEDFVGQLFTTTDWQRF